MKCPHCTKNVSIFTKSMLSFSKDKRCPYCEKGIKSYINLKIAGILIVPFILISLFLLKPILVTLGFNGSYATAFMGGLLILASTRLKSYSSE
jgi:hypothetical protein